MTHAHSGYIIVVIQKQLLGIASTTKWIMYILHYYGNDVGHISEEILNKLDGQIIICVNPIVYGPFAKIHFRMEFQLISNTLNLIS